MFQKLIKHFLSENYLLSPERTMVASALTANAVTGDSVFIERSTFPVETDQMIICESFAPLITIFSLSAIAQQVTVSSCPTSTFTYSNEKLFQD